MKLSVFFAYLCLLFISTASGSWVITYSTYLGGSAADNANAVFVEDTTGNVAIAGVTSSTTNFPHVNAFQSASAGASDAFFTVLSSGNATFSSYLGGTSVDGANSVIAHNGELFIVGQTSSTNFPVVRGFQTARSGPTDAFVARVNSSGYVILSTYFGGSRDETGRGIAVDAQGRIYIVGSTDSTNLPVANRTFAFSNNLDCFVTRFNLTGQGLEFSTYLGGSSDDEAYGVAVDIQNFIYVTGYTGSNDFPVTTNAIFNTLAGNDDVFLSIFSGTSGALVFSTYIGGNNRDLATQIAIDLSGNIFIFGETDSTNFPLAGIVSTPAGRTDVFLLQVNSTRQLQLSRRLGGSQDDNAGGLALSPFGQIYISGTTASNNFPVVNPFKPTLSNIDAFVAELSSTGVVTFASYLGGANAESGHSVAFEDSAIYVVGQTASTNFPTTPDAYQATYGGAGDAFVTKLQFVVSGNSTTGQISATSSGSSVTTGTGSAAGSTQTTTTTGSAAGSTQTSVATGTSSQQTTASTTACTVGSIRCPCQQDGSCDTGLECRSLVCVEVISDATPTQPAGILAGTLLVMMLFTL